MNRNEAERLANAIHSLRPEWPIASLVTFLGKRKDKPLLDTALALTWVALDPETRTPARIDSHGGWSELRTNARDTSPAIRAISEDWCDVCLRPEPYHTVDAYADHEFVAIRSQRSKESA